MKGKTMETYLIFAVIVWWAIEWIKSYMDKFELDEKIQDIAILVLALGGGIGLAVGYGLDMFMLLGLQDKATFVGKLFAGIGIASGSGGVFELLNAIKNAGTLAPKEEPPDVQE